MPRFEPKNPDYRAIAIATFEQQRAMKTLGISIARLEPGEVDLKMDYSPDLTQQHGFIHAGSSPLVSTVPAASPRSR
jgi:acyl-coenzyme A thioesterase PaaI-like protein